MIIKEAAEMLVIPNVKLSSNIWADLGCGSGTFTLALASLLTPESKIYAVDEQLHSLGEIPEQYAGVHIYKHAANFVNDPLPFEKVDGILMANALHYVKDKLAFFAKLKSYLQINGCLLIVEYDTDKPVDRWVPYPLSYQSLAALAMQACFGAVTKLHSKRSAFGGEMYSAIVNL
jgi:ubiquinone/menaquinone biosynthesis C-methylase UbiE